MRVGLLLADHVRPGFRVIAGDYPDLFAALLAEQPGYELATFDLAAGQMPLDLDECDAWIVSGSRHSVYEDVGWILQLADLVRRLDRERRKLVGICFGAQMIGHALGGEVAPAPQGWQVGLKEVAVRQVEPWMTPVAESFQILHSNADQILRPPDRLRVLGSSDGVPVSMLAIGDHFIGFQGHPEFVPSYSAVLMEARRGQIPDAVVDAGLASLSNSPDTRLLATWIARFIEG